MANSPGQGRRPKPPQVRIFSGAHRNDRHGSKDAVGSERVLSELPDPPRGKRAEFKKRWQEYGSEMARIGILTARDLPALELLCDAHQQAAEAEESLEEAGDPYLPTMGGGLQRHPAFTTLREARSLIQKMQLNLGFSPVGRSSVPPTVETGKTKGVQNISRRSEAAGE